MRVSVEGGKYTYVVTETNSHVLRYGELWRDATGDKFTYCMAAEIESLREQVEKLRKERNAFQDQCIRLKNERAVEKGQLAAIASQNEKMRAFLEFAWKYIPMSEYAFEILEHAMNLPNLATPVLNRIRAEGMRMAAEICETTFAHGILQLGHRAAIAKAIRAQADELEKQNG